LLTTRFLLKNERTRTIALREAEQQIQEVANEKRKREEEREQSSEATNKAEVRKPGEL